MSDANEMVAGDFDPHRLGGTFSEWHGRSDGFLHEDHLEELLKPDTDTDTEEAFPENLLVKDDEDEKLKAGELQAIFQVYGKYGHDKKT